MRHPWCIVTTSEAAVAQMLRLRAVMTGFFFVAWFVLPAPQAVVGGALFVAMSGLSIAAGAGGSAKLA